MEASEEIVRYFAAAQIDEIPDDLWKPRHVLGVKSTEQRREHQKTCAVATEIWIAADTDAGRCAATDAYRAHGVHLKYIGSNYHCPMPGYGHQGIHTDFMWGVKGEPEVVNAVWLIDEFRRVH